MTAEIGSNNSNHAPDLTSQNFNLESGRSLEMDPGVVLPDILEIYDKPENEIMIEVKKTGEGDFEVIVEGHTKTKHQVTVDPDYCQSLTVGQTSTEELLVMSFEFLLEREPNTSILRSFNLSVISTYFPEYEHEIRKIMDSKTRSIQPG